jgi:alkaline phosphatase D
MMSVSGNSKRNMLKALGLAPLVSVPRLLPAAGASVFRVAFGSCLHQDKAQPIWYAVLENNPDLFIFLGDNIYGDSDDPAVLADCYSKLAGKEGFRKLRDTTSIMAIWDDHDYGRDDAGAEYSSREASRNLMLDFWQEPEDSERRRRQDGIYTAHTFDRGGKTIQVILPDLRWNRTQVDMVSTAEELMVRDNASMGPYLRNSKNTGTLLGESQWQWLEEQFNAAVDYRILGSSIQLLAEFTGWETWANFPHERGRFLALLARHQDVPTVIISGDVHWCELSRYWPDIMSQPAIELTSSGLTEVWKKISPNRHRVGEAFATENFGLLEFDWSKTIPEITLSVHDINNDPLIRYSLPATFTL